MTRIFMICAALLACFSPAAMAQSLDDAVEARLLPGWRAADGRLMAAVEFKLAPGWKTYWRAPGDAGIPPRFNWAGSRNMGDLAISWPTPRVMDQGGLQVLGYENRLILPLTVTPKRAGKPVELKASVDLGVCKEVCLPITLDIAETLPGDTTKPDSRIVAAMANRPYSARDAGVGRVACSISPIQDGLQLIAEVDLPAMGGREVAVVETDNPQVWVAQGKTSRSGKRLKTVTELYHVEGRSFALNRNGLRITVIGASHSVDIQGCPAG